MNAVFANGKYYTAEEVSALVLQIDDLRTRYSSMDLRCLELIAEKDVANRLSDAMKPVVDAAIAFQVTQESCAALLAAVTAYKACAEKRKCCGPKEVAGDPLAVELCGEEYVGSNCPKCGKQGA